MTTDLYSTVFWQDGQQITFDDLNNMQRLGGARLTDQILEKLTAIDARGSGPAPSKQWELTGQNGANIAQLYAYAVHPGSAYLIQGASNAVIKISSGTLLQKIASSSGTDSSLIAYTFTGSEAFPALANGGANYRIDLLQMALSLITDTPASVDFQDAVTRANTTVAGTLTRRRVQCALSVKQGTPAASPLVPDPDAGSVPVGFVCVGASWTNATAPIYGFEGVASPTTQAVVYDIRMPLGVNLIRVDPVLFKLQTTAWQLSNQGQTLLSSSPTNDMFAAVSTAPGRLIGIMVESTSTLPTSFGLLKVGNTTPSANYVAANSFVSGTVGQTGMIRIYRNSFEQSHIPMGTGPTIQASAVNLHGPPLWTNGYRVPQAPAQGTGVAGPPSGSDWGSLAAGWHNSANGSTVGGIWFVLATGL